MKKEGSEIQVAPPTGILDRNRQAGLLIKHIKQKRVTKMEEKL